LISGIIGVVYAFLFILIISLGLKFISTWGREKTNQEVPLLGKAIFLGLCSIGVLLINSKYFLLDAAAKAGLTIAVLLVIALPVLSILKRKKQKSYDRFINVINRYI
jgi:xanthine/uracil permease